jgi:methylase of polypeptide subunit release factors
MLLNSLKGAEAHHRSIALDINPKALEMTKATAEANHVRLYSILIGC